MLVGDGLGLGGGGVVPPLPPAVPAGAVSEGAGFADGEALGCAEADVEVFDADAEALGWCGVRWCPEVAVELGASTGAVWSGAVVEAPDVAPVSVGVVLFGPEPPPATAKPVAAITSAPTPPSSIARRRRAARAR
ncbi:hypothetical protein [Streptacidiphilus neutrinimicus]|uniref:hypothetical protein n=1 Tax=Streptacidiphilus neutrinimicus TaxID=105420 RepID=UPI0005A794E7|nr:hypothetical protein [Streptacidiphilus neutrinimicus]